jgi:two-component system, cell cycle response regulator
MSSPILDKIRSAENLPSLPTVAIQVLQMTHADDLSVADIARVIQNDPALTSKILRVVNSSLFGMSRKISSLQQAMVVLGLRTVKVMVLSFSLVDSMNKKRSRGFDYQMYWRRSLTTAVIARLLADRLHKNLADEAFVAGLLCDIGMLAAVQCAGDLYAPVVAQYKKTKQTPQHVEQEILGLTHEDITGALMDHWGLPEELTEAARAHHQKVGGNGTGLSTRSPLPRVLQAASALSDIFVADTYAGHLEHARNEIVQRLPIAGPMLDAVLDEIDTHVKETASLFDLNIGQTLSYAEIQMAAMTQLTRLSMAAELERAQTAERERLAHRQVEELNCQNRELTQKATTDALTGIANRAALDRRLVEDTQNCKAHRMPIGVLLMDLDRFKKLNDAFGHQTGDEALRMVGGALKQLETETQFPARYGGEEFAMVVVNATVRELRALAEQIRLTVTRLRVPHGDRFIPITMSLGVAHMNPDDPGLEPRELVKRADHCLYEAKNSGRNRVVCMDSRQAATMTARKVTVPV